MISYIVMTNDKQILERNLLRTLKLKDADEIIVLLDKPSAAIALNMGIDRAKNKIKCFIHSDVVVLDNDRLRSELIAHCNDETGMVGVIGSKNDRHIPWWEKDMCGSIVEARLGLLNFDDGDCACAVMDGLFLATSQHVRFDESFPGFHIYDYDICNQMLDKGLFNWCLRDGKSLIAHNCKGPVDVHALGDSYFQNIERLKNKWYQEASNVPMLQAC